MGAIATGIILLRVRIIVLARLGSRLMPLQIIVEIRVTISDGSRSASIIVPVVIQSTPDMSEW
jgi:hypothetical protein